MTTADLGRASLRSERVELRSLRPADQDWVYDLLTRVSGTRWRYRGRTPAPAEFQADLWRGVLAQFVVIDGTERPVGLVGAYNANTAAGHCHVFAVGASDRGLLVTEATALLADWLFETFEFQKLWVEAPEFNLAQFRSLADLAAIEGRLTNYDYWKGRYWDLVILSVTHERWSSHRAAAASRAASWPRAGSRADPDASLIVEILEDLMPLDSLSAVELLDVLEEVHSRTLDISVLDGVELLPPSDAAVIIQERVRSLDSATS